MCGLPERWKMILLIWSGIVVTYTLRVNMSVAAERMKLDLGWNETEKGYVLSAFYWGYSLGQIPASFYALGYGAKWLFGMSVLIPSLLTMCVPLACQTNFELALFVRCLIGLTESACFPCVFVFFTNWLPLPDKTLMVAVTLSGVYMGEMVAFSTTGYLVETIKVIQGDTNNWQLGGWPSAFYIFGLAGAAWYPFWASYSYESPELHPNITFEELRYIQKGKTYEEFRSGGGAVVPQQQQQLGASISDAQLPGAYNYAVAGGGGGGAGGRAYRSLGNEDDDEISFSDIHRASLRANLLDTVSSVNGSEDGNDDVDVRAVGGVVGLGVRGGAWGGGGAEFVYDRNTNQSTETTIDEIFVRIHNRNAQSGIGLLRRTPWIHCIRSPAFLTLLTASWTVGFASFLLLSEMPSYFTEELGFDLASAGYLSVGPYAALFVSTLGFGRLFGILQAEYGWHSRTIRQIAHLIAVGGSSICLITCSFLSESPWSSYMLIIAAQFMLGASNSGVSCAYLDIAPIFSPLYNAIGNTTSSIAGIAGPIIVSWFLDEHPGSDGWRGCFILCGVFGLVSIILWLVFQTSDIQPKLNTPLPLQHQSKQEADRESRQNSSLTAVNPLQRSASGVVVGGPLQQQGVAYNPVFSDALRSNERRL